MTALAALVTTPPAPSAGQPPKGVIYDEIRTLIMPAQIFAKVSSSCVRDGTSK
jgi:hypothetical protein